MHVSKILPEGSF